MTTEHNRSTAFDMAIHPHTAPADMWKLLLRERYLRRGRTSDHGGAFYSHMESGVVDVVKVRSALDKAAEPSSHRLVALDENCQHVEYGIVDEHDNPSAFVLATDDVLEVEAVSTQEGRTLWELLAPHVQPRPDDTKYLQYLVKKRGEISLRSAVVHWEDIIVENYPSMREHLDDLLAMCTDPEPAGRMAILHGPPGTGKTRLLRGLVARLGHKAQFVIVSPKLAAGATGPDMLAVLVDNKYDPDPDEGGGGGDPGKPYVLIVEDADALLKTRATNDRAGFAGLSALLNASDGIVGSLCDIRIVCTMNTTHRKDNDIDAAALREGRCAVNAYIGSFNEDDAIRRILDLSGVTHKDIITALGGLANLGDNVPLSRIYSIVRKLKKANTRARPLP